MTIYTFKLTKKKIVAFILAVAAIIAAIIILTPGGEASAQTGRPVVSQPAQIKTSKDCAQYIASLGYTVEPEPSDVRKVTIPKTFDDVYTRYNDIQKEYGFDLEPYKSKGVTLYTFYVTNYPEQEDVLIDVLVYNGAVIGGAVYTAAIDGFMHGLTKNPGV